tara:strand:+ start:1230 stop:1436 length:207 start_codon:yes stop_codon:yes gene_type:complete
MPGRDTHQSTRHHYKTQMRGAYNPEKHRRRHLYAHEQLVPVVEEPVVEPVTEEATEVPVEKPKEDTYQ